MERWLPALLAACLWSVVAACNGRSPTGPEPEAGLTIVIDDPVGSFAPHHAAIRRIVEQTVERTRSALAVGTVTFTVTADRAATIPGWGLGGYAFQGTDVDIVIDPSYPDLGNALEARLPQITAHEVHHVVRWRGPARDGTLLDAMVREGLADRFAIELLGSPVAPWSQSFPEDRNSHYLGLAAPLFDSTTFDFRAWFFGPTAELPRWTGYTLGYRLVAAYQARTGRSAAQLIDTPATLFRPD